MQIQEQLHACCPLKYEGVKLMDHVPAEFGSRRSVDVDIWNAWQGGCAQGNSPSFRSRQVYRKDYQLFNIQPRPWVQEVFDGRWVARCEILAIHSDEHITWKWMAVDGMV